MQIPDSQNVFDWLEYRAFAERLGIDTKAHTTKLIIELALDCLPKITHEFHGDDKGAMDNQQRSAACGDMGRCQPWK